MSGGEAQEAAVRSATDAEFFREAARRAAAREGFVLCTVTGTCRSAPRDAGAKMLVASEGRISGTVGGGPLEGVVIHEARQLLARAAPSRAMHFVLNSGGDAAAEETDDLGMKCGGEVTVFLDVILPPARMLVYGGGHVGERVAALAAQVGLCTAVIDDREEFASCERFPYAAEVRRCDLSSDPLGGVVAGPSDFVVIVTRCHAVDEAVLEAALATRARYVGLIGSRRKIALILRNIARRTGRDPRQDDRLHAPIGLRLGDKSPGEVALSILAEVILIKSGGQLQHARLPARDGQKSHAGLRERANASVTPARPRVVSAHDSPVSVATARRDQAAGGTLGTVSELVPILHQHR